RCAGRVGQRAEDVEEGAHAHFAAHRRHVLHGAVVVGREHEADAGGLDAGGDLLRRKVDVGTEGLKRVGAAGTGRDAAATVLGDAGAGGGGDEDRGGGDVEGVRRVAAGADDVDEMAVVRELHRGRQFAHDAGGGGDLADG